MLRAVVLTQYRRVTDRRTDGQTDGQTDGIDVASTALAMRALRRAVKRHVTHKHNTECVKITVEASSPSCAIPTEYISPGAVIHK